MKYRRKRPRIVYLAHRFLTYYSSFQNIVIYSDQFNLNVIFSSSFKIRMLEVEGP